MKMSIVISCLLCIGVTAAEINQFFHSQEKPKVTQILLTIGNICSSVISALLVLFYCDLIQTTPIYEMALGGSTIVVLICYVTMCIIHVSNWIKNKVHPPKKWLT